MIGHQTRSRVYRSLKPNVRAIIRHFEMIEASETSEKKDFTVVTTSGKKVIANLVSANKSDNVNDLLATIKTWVPDFLSMTMDIVFSKAKIWDRVDSEAELEFLRNIDFTEIFQNVSKDTVMTKVTPPPPQENFSVFYRSMVSLEAAQMSMLEKLNVALATEKPTNNDTRVLDKYKTKISNNAHFIAKYGEKVRTKGT